MDKDELALIVSYAIDWKQICFNLHLSLDVEINNDSEVFSEIEYHIADMLLEAIDEDDNFIINE